jgi:hypothetical protein
VIGTLLVSSAAFAEILSDGYYESHEWGQGGHGGAWYDYSSSAAGANGHSGYSGGCGEGGESLWTTETAYLTGSISVYAWAEASADPEGESGDYGFAHASASGSVDGSPYSPSVGVSASASIENPYDSDQGYVEDERTGQYTVGEGVRGDHDAFSGAGCSTGSAGRTYAHSCANIGPSLH